MEPTSTLLLLAVLFGIVLSILWICLPFAVFGVKKRLDELIKLQRDANRSQP